MNTDETKQDVFQSVSICAPPVANPSSPTLKRPYGVTPFWFLNDVLTEDEILRQIAAMDDVGVGGFVLHPRMGLPTHQGWMSAELLKYLRLACEEARRRGLRVILYDEGMYPSGSSAGQVVATNPAWQCRAIECRTTPALAPNETLLASAARPDGTTAYFIDRPIPSVIRGLHYLDETTAEEFLPPAADLLNPDAMACYLRLVHDKYAAHLGDLFGTTITGIFTDEPSLLGRPQITGVVPGTTDILAHARRLTGTDFTPLLPALFFDDVPNAPAIRREWTRAVRLRMEETYYKPMSDWCRAHNLELMGHPERADDIALERYFDVPGQDIVWRWVLPGPTATQGPQSTQAKCASSAAAHLRRHRNSNEFCGAYGHELTYEEMCFLANWLFVRGQNWLIPHAYYYSIRGPRRDERPPDVGLNAPWKDRLAETNRRWEELSQLVAEGEHVCRVAILCSGDECPWPAAEVLFQHQIDFNYWPEGSAQPCPYAVTVWDGIGEKSERAIDATREGWLAKLLAVTRPTVQVSPAVPALRVRRMRFGATEKALLFNEGPTPIAFTIGEKRISLAAFQAQVVEVA